MTFQTTIGRDDLVAFNDDYVSMTFGRLIRRNRWLSTLSTTVIFSGMVWFLLERQSLISAVVVGALVGLIVFLTAPSIQRDRVKKLVNRAYDTTEDKAVMGVHKHVLSDDGIRTTTDHSDSMYRWSALQNIRRLKGHTLLYVGPAKAIVIPTGSLEGATPDEVVAAIVARRPDLPVWESEA